MNKLKPLCIDLDGTLINEDVTLKASKIYLERHFFNVLRMFFWLFLGRAYFKQKLSESVELDPQSLRYNEKFLEFVLKKKEEGHKIFLATASNQIYANKIADYLGIFDGIFASTCHVNLRGKIKARALVMIFGENGFIYAGNSIDDVHIWNKSAECILVSPTKKTLKRMHGQKYLLFE
ncbi:MAG: haloacid dehalogenase-like hydrolase [Holosporaceae bacterium]|jgi:phosphoserine phosphatase|nr:haloacid dehalogenase-like hydrolase [Holosporaceae bacterium]